MMQYTFKIKHLTLILHRSWLHNHSQNKLLYRFDGIKKEETKL